MKTRFTRRLCVLCCCCVTLALTPTPEQDQVTGRRVRQAESEALEGVWGPWSEWAECSQSCGRGLSERRRTCMLPSQDPPLIWNRQSYPPTGVFNNSPMVSAVRPFHNPLYTGTESSAALANHNPGLPLYRNEAGGSGPPQHGSANLESASVYRSLSSSLAYGPRARTPVRPSGAVRGVAIGTVRSVSTNKDSASIRRPVSSIRPGQFGYGWVPFSLPLHRENRQARHTRHLNETLPEEQEKEKAEVKGQETAGRKQRERPRPVHRLNPGVRDRHPEGRASRQAPPPHWRPLTTLPKCPGRGREIRRCTSQVCAGVQLFSRAEQCSAFNTQEFMGRLYDWEPFTAVAEEQQCELTCRPVGFRFYVRQAEQVRDGTPCVNRPADVCVEGRCLSEGCDAVLGSGLVLDRCGVCGGGNTSCERVAGSFLNVSVPHGYRKILDIPAGATFINITERHASANYLALRSGAGQSVVNGRWAVDPPGEYSTSGTSFTYTQHKERGQTLTAPGPTTTQLQLYIIFHKQNPGVDYEYYTPVEKQKERVIERGRAALREISVSSEPLEKPSAPHVSSSSSSSSSHRWPRPHGAGSNRNARIPPRTDVPLDSGPALVWRQGALSECSASCGRGVRVRDVACVNRHTQQEVPVSSCDSASKPAAEETPCHLMPCSPYWDVGVWSECSVSCGAGLQQRHVQCRQSFGNLSTMVLPQRCSSVPRPNSTQSCFPRSCSHWQISSNWSKCSVDCGVGERTRSVRCVSNHGNTVNDRECKDRLRPQGSEDCHMGPCVTNWFFTDWSGKCSAACGPGFQRREVVCVSGGGPGDGGGTLKCEGERPAHMKACNDGPCTPTFLWFTGPWGQCNVQCGNGTQRRDVICVKISGSEQTVAGASDCPLLLRPVAVQTCDLQQCEAQWFTSGWSACSRSCDRGQQTRDVQCLSAGRRNSHDCDVQTKPTHQQSCNTAPCSPSTDENCKDRQHNCVMVVQARLCVYSYYKTACCLSCTQNAQRAKRH